MDPALIQTGLTLTAALLIGGSAAGAGWFAFTQGRRGSQLRARLAPEAQPSVEKVNGKKGGGAGFAPVIGWVRRLGDAQAVRDPNQVSSLRFKLVQAGFPNREAVPIFLGAKLAAMAGAALILMLVVPFAMRQAGGQGAAAAAGLLSLVAIMVMSPKFYGEVWNEPVVKYGLAGIGFWIFIGNLIMRRMIDMRL